MTSFAPVGAAPAAQPPAEIDGFQLLINALKLNGIDTLFGLPGIPITDLTRKAQAQGMRVISFRHEQNAGNAAAAAGYLTQKPGICLTVSAPGFLNGLSALANATVNCFPMILISGSSEREIVDLQQGDYEEMDQLAVAKPLCKAAYRVLHAQDIGVGIARAIRAALSGRPGGVYLDLPAKLFGQTMDAAAGQASLIKVVDAAPRQLPAPEAVERALALLKNAKRPLILLGKGAAYAQADADIESLTRLVHVNNAAQQRRHARTNITHQRRGNRLVAVHLGGRDIDLDELFGLRCPPGFSLPVGQQPVQAGADQQHHIGFGKHIRARR